MRQAAEAIVIYVDHARPPDWSPDDFVRNRAFCPASQIQQLLDSYSAATKAGFTLLLSFDRTTVFRNLTFIHAPEGDLSAQGIRGLALEQPPAARRRPPGNQPFWEIGDTSADLGIALKLLSDPDPRFYGHSSRFYARLLELHLEQPWSMLASQSRGRPSAIECIFLSQVPLAVSTSFLA